jgi:hypothetical protein
MDVKLSLQAKMKDLTRNVYKAKDLSPLGKRNSYVTN